MDIFTSLGSIAIGRVQTLTAVWSTIALSLSSLVFRFYVGRKATFQVLLKQVYFTGFQAIPIISWIALILGIIVLTQLLSILPGLGGERLIGDILVWVVVREVGPLLAAVVVIARSGTAIASELGTMRIAKQLTALEIMGIDPVHYLVMPRVIGTAISTFVLTFYFEVVAILGGYLLAGFGKNITFSIYMSSILGSMGLLEVVVSVLKSLLFGLVIGAICTSSGLTVGSSITEVPQATTKAVIGSLAAIFVIDALITTVFFIRLGL
ncbi:MAG: ABC transporter permease [Proteobacteria bacterium]|nr:ABC transporter permease [Pseudomonadota bacterium]